MNTREFDRGYQAGWKNRTAQRVGDSYTVPGRDKTDDYLMGFVGGAMAADAFWNGWDDGLAGRRVACKDKGFEHEYWRGYQIGVQYRHEDEARHAA